MEGVPIISVADLLRHTRPLTGAAYLNSPSPPPLKKQKPDPSKPPPLPHQNPNPRSFSPLANHAALVGAVNLSAGESLSFSDASSAVPCSIQSLETSIIGQTIRVLAWNFIPFKNSGGVLEIIRWAIPSTGLRPPSLSISASDSVSGCRRICGLLEAISPVFRVPCRSSVDVEDSVGFLAEMISCPCHLCRKSPLIQSRDGSKSKTHSFTKRVFVYFVGQDSRWRPVLNELVGKLVVVSGLKKKSVFVGAEEQYLVFVTTEKSVAMLCQNALPIGRAVNVRRNWEDGVYIGVVTGVYMQCMAVELDEKVWLLITDSLLVPQHSFRIGAIVSVRNFHLVRPEFSWTKMLLLGTCTRTSISVKSFSLVDTRCYFRNQSHSLLEKFLNSLVFSARFWVLLLVSCFRRKFGRILSDKEILGSKHHEGMAQIYARASLPSSAFQNQNGVFMEFCKHDQCTFHSKLKIGPLNLVVPLSNFISKCEAIWVSVMSEIQNDSDTIGMIVDSNHLSCQTASSCSIIRRTISSKDIGLILMGTLKISPSSGRLQLADSTGSVDVVIPDLLSKIDGQSIHEVKEYNVVIEGFPAQLVSPGFRCSEPLSCKNIFEQFSHGKLLNQVTIYVHYFLEDSTCLNVPSHMPSCKVSSADLRRGTGEVFHLLLVTHKFPAIENLQGGPSLSNNPSLFAEALILPYDLILSEQLECTRYTEMFQGYPKLEADNNECQQDPEKRWSERPNLFQATSEASVPGSKNNYEVVARRSKKIPCRLTFRSNNLEESLPGYFCHTDGIALKNIVHNQWAPRILLEFKSASICNYQLLHPGAYYILRCSKDGLPCNTKGYDELKHDNFFVNSQTTLWSLSFPSGEYMHQREPPLDCFSWISSTTVGKAFSGKVFQNELIFRRPLGKMHVSSDVLLQFPSEATGQMKDEIEAVEDMLTRLLHAACEIVSVSSCIQMMGELANPFSVADSWSRKLSQGNLISLRGDIENIHNSSGKSKCFSNPEHTNINRRKSHSICLHVFGDDQMVRICGYISKCTYPVGMGPGANATFLRVLLTCDSSKCRKLLLTPVSYVIIHSVKEPGNQQRDKGSVFPFKYNTARENLFSMVSLGLVSQLVQCGDGALVRFQCRVVTINFLVFEKHAQDFGKSQSRRQLNMPVFKIPLAGFVLDDGSSICCCWADAGRAKTLLKLPETAYWDFSRSCRRVETCGRKRSQDTVGYQLEKILQKHQRIVVRNHGVFPYSSHQNFTFSVDSDEIFSKTEERLLRCILLNACAGSIFNIVGSKINPDALDWYDSEVAESQVALQSMQNVWVGEVGDVNPAEEARNLIYELEGIS